MEESIQSKSAIRRQMSALRKALPSIERERASRAICVKLTGDSEIAAATSKPGVNAIAVYLASPKEIDLSDFICEMLARHADVVAPRWNGKDYDLAKLHGLDERHLRRGPMNILEPAAAEIVEPSQVAVWIIPGLAFTKDGARLGYGGGWYDRLLAKSNATSLKIGVAYSFQILPDLPREPHDIPLTRIVTSP